MQRVATLSLAAAFACFASACTSNVATTLPTTPTLIAVSPDDFRGEIPCTPAPGAMRSYVATIYDLGTVDAPTDPFPLPSSVLNDADIYRPTPCERVAAFSYVIPLHRYDAEIDAYDRTDLHALGPGGRQLVDDATGEYVAPRWTTSCGRQPDVSAAGGPITAAQYLTRFVRGCAALTAHEPATPTGISVGLDGALGTLVCGDSAGTVSSFTVSTAGLTDQSASCGQHVVFSDLEPGRGYSFDVLAYELGVSTPRWGTSCYRTALFGAIVPAACDPLVELQP